jgi:hypothetical protein
MQGSFCLTPKSIYFLKLAQLKQNRDSSHEKSWFLQFYFQDRNPRLLQHNLLHGNDLALWIGYIQHIQTIAAPIAQV